MEVLKKIKEQFVEQQPKSELETKDLDHFVHGNYNAKKHQENYHVWTKGEGCKIFDQNGKMYIDGISGLFCMLLAHGREELSRAAYDQMNTLEYACSLTSNSNIPAINLSNKLIELAHRERITNMKSAFFCSGGAESNEAAISLSLNYWQFLKKESKRKIISFENCYHGSTFIAASLNAYDSYGWKRFSEVSNPFIQVPFPDKNNFDPKLKMFENETPSQAVIRILNETVKKEGKDSIAAIIIEPIQGNNGIALPHEDFYPMLREFCTNNDILFIADEVLTFGKTGRFFAISKWNLQPDLITIAKGLSSGYLPLGCLLISEKIHSKVFEQDKEKIWKFDYTYSAHPTPCAVGLKNLEIIEREGLIEKGARMGEYLLNSLQTSLQNFRSVKMVRGNGILIAIEFIDDFASEIKKELMEHSRPVITKEDRGKTALIVSPPLIMQKEECDSIVSTFFEVLSKVDKKFAKSG